MPLPSAPAGLIVPHDVVERLGIGLAQLRVLLLGSGIWFVDGMELTLCTSVTASVANQFNLSGAEESSLTTLVWLGLGLGALAGGAMGDALGRKKPIVAAYVTVAIFGSMTALAATYTQLVVLRLATGFCMGMGMPPSQAMQSELTPDSQKMVMMMGRGMVFALGAIFCAGVMVIDDPTMQHLNLRWCFCWCAVPSAILGLLAAAFLPESPLYLASSGEDEAARKVFRDMGRLNAFPEAPPGDLLWSIERMRCDTELAADSITVWLKVRAVFGARIWTSTFVLMLFSFTANLLEGHSYAEPLVLTESPTALDPGWQIFVESLYALPGCVAVVVLPWAFTRKEGAIVILLTAAVGLLSFAIAVSYGQSTAGEVAVQVSTLGLKMATKCAFLFAHQLASEIYPTVVRSTGTAIDIGAGRAGGMFAPPFFEFCARVTNSKISFYYASTVFVLFVTVVIAVVLPRDMQDCRDAAVESAEEAMPMRAKEKRTDDP